MELEEFSPPHFYNPISLTAYDHDQLQQHIGKTHFHINNNN